MFFRSEIWSVAAILKKKSPLVKKNTILELQPHPHWYYLSNQIIFRAPQNLFIFQRSNYSIHPRKSLSRSRQHVQFVDVAKLSSSFSDESPRSKVGDSPYFDEKRFHTSSKDTSFAMSSKESTTSTGEFYSPNTSLDAKEEPQTNDRNELETEKMIHLEEFQGETEVKQDIGKIEVEDLESKLTQSPRARKSYKR